MKRTRRLENRPGGAGIIGMETAAKSTLDGHTMIMEYQSVASVNPVLYNQLPYDMLISQAATSLLATAKTFSARARCARSR